MIYRKIDCPSHLQSPPTAEVPSFLRTPEPPRGPGLPRDAAARKGVPIVTGVLDYFPDAIAAVAECSRVGNEQHNPGSPLHWDRSKSGDEADALGRHLLERGSRDSDGIRHSAKLAWRALALLQKEIEGELGVKTDATAAIERAFEDIKFID